MKGCIYHLNGASFISLELAFINISIATMTGGAFALGVFQNPESLTRNLRVSEANRVPR